MKNIVLVGFMGTGKTTVAKALAERLKMRYVSIDELIEKKEKRQISDIFAKEGEGYFRQAEKDVVREASSLESVVIDAGGGVVINQENLTNLKKSGTVICLSADIEAILQRTKGHKHRPLLNVEDRKNKIKELLAKRAPYYAKADFMIDTSKLTVDEVVKKIEEIALKM